MSKPHPDIHILTRLPQAEPKLAEQKLKETFAGFRHKIVVLDDDPTGTQTVHGVSVYTDWETKTLREAFHNEAPMFFILTNSRSLSTQNTARLHREIAAVLSAVSVETHIPFLLLSRGDSTLRGHYPLETDILRDTMEEKMDIQFDGEILCPFFEEGGRFTINNIHYVQDGNSLIPAGETEFARDKTFPYNSSDLTEYIEEKTGGLYSSRDCVVVSLEELRKPDYEGVTQKLLNVQKHQKIIINAASYIDINVFAVCFLCALKQGKNFIIRCAGSLPKVLGNIPNRPLLTKQELIQDDPAYGGLVVIGSHVKKTTIQLEALKYAKTPLEFIEFDASACLQEDGLNKEAARVLKKAEALIKAARTVVIYTSRQVLAPENIDREELLALSVTISDSLTSIVAKLSVHPKFIIAKGGITSSDVATKGLAVKKAEVMGQIRKGVPVWMTGEESKFPHTPYIIFPGNVGTNTTLCEVVDELN